MKIANIFKGDKGVWAVFFFLCVISIVEVFSASSALTYKSQDFMQPIFFHCLTIFIGLVITVLVLNIQCGWFKVAAPLLWAFSAITLIAVLAWGEHVNGATRAFQLPGFSFQPSEFAKGSMVLWTAYILSFFQQEDGSGASKDAWPYIIVPLGILALLIGVENLSTALLLIVVIYLMMFIGRIPMIQMGVITGIGLIVAGIFVALVLIVGRMDTTAAAEEQQATTALAEKASDGGKGKKEDSSVLDIFTHRMGTWYNRYKNWGNHVSAKDYDIDKNFQVGHANVAIASSGVIGKGPGNSVERDFLPQAFSDFIYAIIIEEMGVLGAVAVVFLYIMLLFRTERIARRCQNNFPAFLVMGLALLMVMQALINMLVAVGIGPVTGQPLPLISKGGSSTVTSCAYIGIILSVSRSAKRKENAVAEA